MPSENKSYLNCVHCGKCLPVCPSYNIDFNEFLSPRGRVRIVLTDYADSLLLRPGKIMESMSTCLLCGRCEKVCPNDVNITELVANEKIKLEEFGRKRFSSDKLALNILKNKRKVLLKSALKIANIPFFKKLSGRNSPLPEGKSFIGKRDLIFNADTSLEKSQSSPLKHGQVIMQSADEDGKNIFKAGYFSGCVFNGIYSQISIDTVTSLTKNGVEVFVPKMQGCCGLPFISSGDLKSFKELAVNNALAFKGKKLDYIVTSCASCSYSINKLYPKYFNENEENYTEILDFSKKLISIWAFFNELKKHGIEIKKGKLDKETKAVFHIPCHLSNMPDFKPVTAYEKLIGEPGLIADKIAGLKLKPLKYNYCCGNGGMFNVRHYDLSKKITKRKFEEIKEAAPQEILTSCSGCIFSLKDQSGIVKHNEVIPVNHLIGIYARSLRGEK
ncbi:MAG: (Fe-S)-binding protein [Candidatus Acidulodesulfobacterium acidiphilum]|uniref:Glycolate oxidase iron-sulfur subunit n=1 Tax=Candidatus Acidulodesulfobacterium acidiphilum TaxID=2597224 RepID=A0A520X886_9DELT|nr:MAG: (Fe-S)-binding protein [Candidatus Acidulodesulfobacterium acidiphilum]